MNLTHILESSSFITLGGVASSIGSESCSDSESSYLTGLSPFGPIWDGIFIKSAGVLGGVLCILKNEINIQMIEFNIAHLLNEWFYKRLQYVEDIT